jgi:hypothetical protein
MENLKNITEFVVVSNLENRALNAGISRAQNWWKNHNNRDDNNGNNPPPQRVNPIPQAQAAASPPIATVPGQLLVTIVRGQDLHESRLSILTGATSSSSSSEHPYVVLECNNQRFQTAQADSQSSNRNPQWSSNNGPFGFNIFDPYVDRLVIWVQQDSFRMMKRNEPKTLAMGEINVSQLIGQQQVWVPLRKDNKPTGQILLQVTFYAKNDPPPPYH